jgi:hypothetical protein
MQCHETRDTQISVKRHPCGKSIHTNDSKANKKSLKMAGNSFEFAMLKTFARNRDAGAVAAQPLRFFVARQQPRCQKLAG